MATQLIIVNGKIVFTGEFAQANEEMKALAKAGQRPTMVTQAGYVENQGREAARQAGTLVTQSTFDPKVVQAAIATLKDHPRYGTYGVTKRAVADLPLSINQIKWLVETAADVVAQAKTTKKLTRMVTA